MQRGRDERNKVRPWTANSRPRRSTPARPTRARSTASSAAPTTTRTPCWARTRTPNGTVVRTLRPHADAVRGARRRRPASGPTRWSGCTTPGCSPAWCPRRPATTASQVRYGDDVRAVVDDPYRWLPTLGEVDLHLIGEGRHERLWDALGAHVRTYDTPDGDGHRHRVRGLGAQRAQGVRVIGDFDGWDGSAHPMRSLGSSGVWELFVPGRRRRHPLQVPHPRPGRRVAREGRPDGVRHRGPAVHRVRRHRSALRVGRRRRG